MILSGDEVDIQDSDVRRKIKSILASSEFFDMPTAKEGPKAGTPIVGYRGFAVDENDKYAGMTGIMVGAPFIYGKDEVMHNEQSREGYYYGLDKELIQQYALHQAVLHIVAQQNIPEGGYEVWEIEGTATRSDSPGSPGFTAQDIHIRGDTPYFKISKDEVKELIKRNTYDPTWGFKF